VVDGAAEAVAKVVVVEMVETVAERVVTG